MVEHKIFSTEEVLDNSEKFLELTKNKIIEIISIIGEYDNAVPGFVNSGRSIVRNADYVLPIFDYESLKLCMMSIYPNENNGIEKLAKSFENQAALVCAWAYLYYLFAVVEMHNLAESEKKLEEEMNKNEKTTVETVNKETVNKEPDKKEVKNSKLENLVSTLFSKSDKLFK